VDALEIGLCRCASIVFNPGWDTHQDNDAQQGPFFQDLFGLLSGIREDLASRAGHSGGTMAEETVIVVLSEMARTPNLNADLGKDHWPVTSALLVGPGIAGGRTIGGFDPLFYGARIDPASGAEDSSGVEIMAGNLGATLLTLADVDPAEWLPGFQPLPGLLA
jgi:uncharacterized protein (DUF1501 family)